MWLTGLIPDINEGVQETLPPWWTVNTSPFVTYSKITPWENARRTPLQVGQKTGSQMLSVEALGSVQSLFPTFAASEDLNAKPFLP